MGCPWSECRSWQEIRFKVSETDKNPTSWNQVASLKLPFESLESKKNTQAITPSHYILQHRIKCALENISFFASHQDASNDCNIYNTIRLNHNTLQKSPGESTESTLRCLTIGISSGRPSGLVPTTASGGARVWRVRMDRGAEGGESPRNLEPYHIAFDLWWRLHQSYIYLMYSCPVRSDRFFVYIYIYVYSVYIYIVYIYSINIYSINIVYTYIYCIHIVYIYNFIVYIYILYIICIYIYILCILYIYIYCVYYIYTICIYIYILYNMYIYIYIYYIMYIYIYIVYIYIYIYIV